MFDGVLMRSGGTNQWIHNRQPTPIGSQTVIRMNRDTLYSSVVVDLSQGATVTMPDAAGRYMSLSVVNADHYINRIIHEPGMYELTLEEYGTPHVLLILRTLVDPADPQDIATVSALQDAVTLKAGSTIPFTHPDYDEDSRKETHDALVALSTGLTDAAGMFGSREAVDPVRHVIGTAIGWGGLPESEAYYYMETEPRPAGRFTFTLKDVPVDGFWSVTIYNRDGYLAENPYDAQSVNSVTAFTNQEGLVKLNLAPERDGLTNYLYVMDGWNYSLRLYRPRPEVLDRTWEPPKPRQAGRMLR